MDEDKNKGRGADAGAVAGGEDVGRGVRVLVVDDSHVDRKIVERLLFRSGLKFEVVTVESGKKAMEVLGLNEQKDECTAENESKLDIVLTDYCMPEMNGYDLLKAVKENASSNAIPVVIMSSENDPQRISRCLDSGAEAFMLKPLRVEDIQRLGNYAKTPEIPAPKVGTKRKLPLDSMSDGQEPERRPRLAGVAVA